MAQRGPKRSLSPVRRPMLSRNRSGSHSPTRGLTRATSFNSKSLGFANPFNRKHVRSSNNPGEDEVNLFMSDIVSAEYCKEKLEEVRRRTAVVKMEIEDLLVSKHCSVIPIIKQLVVGGSRPWEWIRFTDTADADDFKAWQSKKHNISQGFEATIAEKSKYEDVMTFECTIRLSKGTSHLEVKKILQAIHDDDHVTKWSFEGSLYNFDDDKKPLMLQQLVNAESGDLVDEIVIVVKCGWNTKLSRESKTLLEKCIQYSKKPEAEPQQKASKAPMRRTRTHSPMKRPQGPRNSSRIRSPVRRCISADETGRSGVGRIVSMPIRHRRTPLSPLQEDGESNTPMIRRSRRATSPTNDGEEEQWMLEAVDEERPTRGRSVEKRDSHSTRTSITSTTSTASTVSSTEDDQHHRFSTSLSNLESLPTRRPKGRKMRALASGDDDMSVASAPDPRRKPPRRARTTGEKVAAPCIPSRTSLSPTPSKTTKVPLRRTMSLQVASETPDFNWSNFNNTKTTKCEITPDYDWKTGAYRKPMASKAA